MPNGEGLVYQRQAGTGAAVILGRTGISPREAFTQIWADTKARRQRDEAAKQNAIKGLENYKADGWYKDDVVLQTKVANLRKSYVDALKGGFNPESIDPDNPKSVEAYENIRKAKDDLTLANAYSKQSKDLFNKTALTIARDPKKYTPESIQAHSDYYSLPFETRIKTPEPQLEAATPPEKELDWYKSLGSIKSSMAEYQKEVGATTTLNVNAARNNNRKKVEIWLQGPNGEAMIKHYGGDYNKALAVAEEHVNASADTKFKQWEDEARAGGKEPTEEDVLRRKEMVWKLQNKDTTVLSLLAQFQHPEIKQWVDHTEFDETGEFTKIVMYDKNNNEIDSINISKENNFGEVEINRFLNITGKGKAGPQVSYERDWAKIPSYSLETGTTETLSEKDKQSVASIQNDEEGAMNALVGKDYRGGKIKSAERTSFAGTEKLVLTMEGSNNTYSIEMKEVESGGDYGYKEILAIISRSKPKSTVTKGSVR